MPFPNCVCGGGGGGSLCRSGALALWRCVAVRCLLAWTGADWCECFGPEGMRVLSTIVFVHAWSPTWTQTPVPGTGYWAQVAPWSWLTSSGGQLCGRVYCLDSHGIINRTVMVYECPHIYHGSCVIPWNNRTVSSCVLRVRSQNSPCSLTWKTAASGHRAMLRTPGNGSLFWMRSICQSIIWP